MRTLPILLLLLITTLPAAHADYNSASAAYNRGDRNASFMEFRRLAELGDVKAQFMLGNQYQKGEGVLQDFVQAHKWFNLAAFAGHPLASEYRDRVARQMTSAQVAKAQQLARQWRPGNETQRLAKPTGNVTARIQRLLNDHGYDAGVADGKIGRKTRQAIRRYQADSGLYQDGEATTALLEFMQAQFPGTDTASSSQVSAATAQPTPAPPPTVTAKADTRLPQLVLELQQLTREGERSRAANNRFLERLRDLANRYNPHWPWAKVLLDEAFSESNYVRNTAWQIVSGDFFLTRGEGLQSRVPKPAAAKPAKKHKGRDLAINLLGSILNQQQGDTNLKFGAVEEPAQVARIQIPLRISNSFALRVELQSKTASGSVSFDLFHGSNRQTGYRLSYTQGRPAQLQLLRFNNRGTQQLAAANRSVDLADGRRHRLFWSRDNSGQMRVSIDGDERLRASDRTDTGEFDGLGYVNQGGSYTLGSLRLYGIR